MNAFSKKVNSEAVVLLDGISRIHLLHQAKRFVVSLS